jgi:hypothetical protein
MTSKALLSICAGLLTAAPASAHHNAAAHYQLDGIIEVSGVVTEFRLVNPHSRLYLEVMNNNGVAERWMAEGDASVALRRSGWTAGQFKAGDEVHIVGRPSHDGSNMLEWETITLSDGAAVGGGNGRFEERARFLEERLAEFRRLRGR